MITRRRAVWLVAVAFPFCANVIRIEAFTAPSLLRPSSGTPTAPSVFSIHPRLTASKNDNDNAGTEEPTELDRIKVGFQQVLSGEAFDSTNVNRLWSSPEDIVGVWALAPLVAESLRTAFTGQIHTQAYVICAATTVITALAHARMSADSERDFRAPRMAEYRTVYEFSALYCVPFAWLLYRITPAFPQAFETADPIMCVALSAVTLYGFLYNVVSRKQLDDVNSSSSGKEGSSYRGPLLPSTLEYQTQAQLYLTGNLVINGLACLFLPFAWTLCFRGTEWWERVQTLHPNQAAFLGVSLLVAVIGDVSGNLFLRLKQLQIAVSTPGIVSMGIFSNFWLLLFPEIVFNSIYTAGVSEVGFYWD